MGIKQGRKPRITYVIRGLVGVSGFEPEASWTRTKRDTKLRHTPIDQIIIMRNFGFVKSRSYF